MNRKLRFGMIGGGRGAFIGAVHRLAAAMDGKAELVAGAFSSDPDRSKLSGADLFLDPSRVYGTYAEMAAVEARKPAGERLDFVAIVTPNHQHFPAAKACLGAGFNVVCDKPVTFDLKQAKALQAIVKKTGKVFVLTHNYTGNAMVKQARDLVRSGELGEIRKIVVEYSQGWMSGGIKLTDKKQPVWRSDPARSGAGGCVGDIGTHAENLARYVTGLKIDSVCAELTTFLPGGRLDDDCNLLVRYHGGARGVLHASQIAIGEENALSLRVYGTRASIEWAQEYPDDLVVKFADRPRQVWRRGNPYLGKAASAVSRIPPGHPEGYLEAFGNVYRAAFRAIAAEVEGRPAPADADFPTISDGVEGMAFIAAVVRSSRLGAKWVKLPTGA